MLSQFFLFGFENQHLEFWFLSELVPALLALVGNTQLSQLWGMQLQGFLFNNFHTYNK